MKEIIILIFFVCIVSCKISTRTYPIYKAPDGIVIDVRNGMMYCYNDSGRYVVTYLQFFKGLGDFGRYPFSWMYRAGDNFSSTGVQDTIRKWTNLRRSYNLKD